MLGLDGGENPEWLQLSSGYGWVHTPQNTLRHIHLQTRPHATRSDLRAHHRPPPRTTALAARPSRVPRSPRCRPTGLLSAPDPFLPQGLGAGCPLCLEPSCQVLPLSRPQFRVISQGRAAQIWGPVSCPSSVTVPSFAGTPLLPSAPTLPYSLPGSRPCWPLPLMLPQKSTRTSPKLSKRSCTNQPGPGPRRREFKQRNQFMNNFLCDD